MFELHKAAKLEHIETAMGIVLTQLQVMDISHGGPRGPGWIAGEGEQRGSLGGPSGHMGILEAPGGPSPNVEGAGWPPWPTQVDRYDHRAQRRPLA